MKEQPAIFTNPSPSEVPRISGASTSALAPAFELQAPTVPPISKLASMNLDSGPATHFDFDLSAYGDSMSLPKTPPYATKLEVIDLCTPTGPALIDDLSIHPVN